MIRWCTDVVHDKWPDRWMDGQKKWHIEVGAPPNKNPQRFLKTSCGKENSWIVAYEHSWERVSNPPFYIYPLYCLPLHLSQVLSNPPPPPEPPYLLLFLLPCFFGWKGDHTIFDVSFYLMTCDLSNLGILVPVGPFCMFYVTRCQVYWGLTHVVFCQYSDLISHTQT